MIPMFRKLWFKIRYDEVAVRRWGRALLMAFAGGGIAFADQLAAITGSDGKWIRIAAVVAGFVSVAINLGEKNEKPPEAPQP